MAGAARRVAARGVHVGCALYCGGGEALRIPRCHAFHVLENPPPPQCLDVWVDIARAMINKDPRLCDEGIAA
eukprot:8857272-Lingulodinium_polyedra.AAC.1